MCGSLKIKYMDKQTLDSMNRIINYVYDAEAKEYTQLEMPRNHIFVDIKRVADYVDRELSNNN